MVPLCMWTEREVKWYHCVCGQKEQSNGTTVSVDRESSQILSIVKIFESFSRRVSVVHTELKFKAVQLLVKLKVIVIVWRYSLEAIIFFFKIHSG